MTENSREGEKRPLSMEAQYRRQTRRKRLLIFAAAALLIASAYVFTTLGMAQTSLRLLGDALWAYFSGPLAESADPTLYKVLLLLRLPRIALAVLAGAGLAVAGAVMQSVTRNVLVSPFTLGISAAAVFGASLAILFGGGLLYSGEGVMILGAFLSALTCGLIVYTIARQINLQPMTIVLVGIGLNYFFSALTATLEFFAREHKLAAVVEWTFGSFNRATWESVAVTAAVTIPGLLLLWSFALSLNAMSQNDDETARSLGVRTDRVRTVTGLAAILVTAAIISFTGIIGFVGLIAPHVARLIIGSDHVYYLPFTALSGALLLLWADTLGKFILYPVNIPVGIVVSFIGVPLFLQLIFQTRKEGR